MTAYITVEIREEVSEFPYYRTRSYIRREVQVDPLVIAERVDGYLDRLEAYWTNVPKPPYHWLGAEAEAA